MTQLALKTITNDSSQMQVQTYINVNKYCLIAISHQWRWRAWGTSCYHTWITFIEISFINVSRIPGLLIFFSSWYWKWLQIWSSLLSSNELVSSLSSPDVVMTFFLSQEALNYRNVWSVIKGSCAGSVAC